MTRSDPDIARPRRDSDMMDYGTTGGDDFVILSRDRVPVRSMAEGDLAAIVRIDRRHTGRDRTNYYRRKLAEAMSETGIRVSLVAEIEGQLAGFVMARVDFGDFGLTDPVAVIDTFGVDPGYGRRSVGRALFSQLFANLSTLQIEGVRTMTRWNAFDTLAFMEACGFAPAQRVLLAKRLA